MKQVLLRKGSAVVEEVPAPLAGYGQVLVEVHYSCISAGTEVSGLQTSGMPLWKRAIKQPENVKKVMKMVATNGISRTRKVVSGQLAAGNATGYSAAGTVVAIGEGVDDIEIGDRVACAGAQCAHHAEFIAVPRNLLVPVPDNLDLAKASTVTLGAIAMQGIRRAEPTLGETFVVLGLGLLGQLTAQMLRANGCRVIGIDLDAKRLELAKNIGLDIAVTAADGDTVEQVYRLTDGYGADGVIITAATPSDSVVASAFNLCRRKARVVLVGDVGLHLKRQDFYQKELDFRISCSYGPGRYDANYEEHGLDYPIGYVRWTENRNMVEYLRELAAGKIILDGIISGEYPLDKAPDAYQALQVGNSRPLILLLSYAVTIAKKPQHVINNPDALQAGNKQLRLAVIGPGGFAKAVHLPNIRSLGKAVHLQAVCARSGHNALAIAKQYEACRAMTDPQEIFAANDIDAVLIATRHDTHADLVLRALHSRKHVLVEKPLALRAPELAAIMDFYEIETTEPKPLLLTGYNRRFSKIMQSVAKVTARRANPMIINYRMNAGHIAADHWVHGEQGGGRNLGEACHIYDLFTFLTGAQVLSVTAKAITPSTDYYRRNDNFIATMTFADGSVATLTYTALGNRNFPKETMEVYVDGKVLAMNDYKELKIHGSNQRGIQSQTPQKGHLEELRTFIDAIKDGSEWPIPLWQQQQAMAIALQVEQQITPTTNITEESVTACVE